MTKRNNNTDILFTQIQRFIFNQEKIITKEEGYPISGTSFEQLQGDVEIAVEEALNDSFMQIIIDE